MYSTECEAITSYAIHITFPSLIDHTTMCVTYMILTQSKSFYDLAYLLVYRMK